MQIATLKMKYALIVSFPVSLTVCHVTLVNVKSFEEFETTSSFSRQEQEYLIFNLRYSESDSEFLVQLQASE